MWLQYIDEVVGAKRGMEKDQDEKVHDKEDEETGLFYNNVIDPMQ